jgi:mannitol-specific phosphotransferase system IIBC component
LKGLVGAGDDAAKPAVPDLVLRVAVTVVVVHVCMRALVCFLIFLRMQSAGENNAVESAREKKKEESKKDKKRKKKERNKKKNKNKKKLKRDGSPSAWQSV